MGDDFEPSDSAYTDAQPPSNRRILWLMLIVGIIGAIAGAAFFSAGFGIGVLIGTAFAFLNYIWLQRSLKTIFAAAERGERPRMLVGKYFLRYLVLGLVIAVVYIAGWVPIASLILGMAAFGFATVIEGFIRIFSSIFSSREI
ncbi:MAG: ATP synthase subunit I [Acidobacteriota bacterium]